MFHPGHGTGGVDRFTARGSPVGVGAVFHVGVDNVYPAFAVGGLGFLVDV